MSTSDCQSGLVPTVTPQNRRPLRASPDTLGHRTTDSPFPPPCSSYRLQHSKTTMTGLGRESDGGSHKRLPPCKFLLRRLR
ncbi:hypothetical protein THAOC_19095 [Thalassiosira oceanica]|uniref:Uncharacterized protein n=1 Tax=Thalassiosira oceanica TaxID=159749 RepID=K0SQ87_THAOC|nr:hypothetical protein THAOC_19095 [Thalassiosira oceanica]|eukprot:EJK60532.1 hypothetical protein THAOC_19095 [Thalassiosira oceanica]